MNIRHNSDYHTITGTIIKDMRYSVLFEPEDGSFMENIWLKKAGIIGGDELVVSEEMVELTLQFWYAEELWG